MMLSAEELEVNWRVAQKEAGEQFLRADRAELTCRRWAAVLSDISKHLGASADEEIDIIMRKHFPDLSPKWRNYMRYDNKWIVRVKKS